MARVTQNRQVENLDGNFKREGNTTAPAFETENARHDQLGIFHQANIAINQSGVALKLNGLDSDAAASFIAPRAGTIVGMAWALTAASTHTAGAIQPTVGGTAVGTSVAIDGGGTSAVVDMTPVSFVEGALIGVALTTDANWLPTTTDLTCWVIVRWTA
jgi:hypothetical protein